MRKTRTEVAKQLVKFRASLEKAENAGLEDSYPPGMSLEQLARVWRSVPNRKQYVSGKGHSASAKESVRWVRRNVKVRGDTHIAGSTGRSCW